MIIEIRIEPTDRAKTLALLASEDIPPYDSILTLNISQHLFLLGLMEFITPGSSKVVTEDTYLQISEICREAMKASITNAETNDYLKASGDIQELLRQLSVAAEANEFYSDTQVGKIYLHNT